MTTTQELDQMINDGVEYHYTNYRGDARTMTVDSWDTIKHDIGQDGFDTPLGRLAVVDEFGGEGQGDEYWIVVSLTDSEGNVQLFRKSGWYASYDGGYLDGATEEVEVYERTIKDYRRKS